MSVSTYSDAHHQNINRYTGVTETKTSESPERVFTYKHIFEASNVLAHHLCENGVVNGRSYHVREETRVPVLTKS